jgi:two-component system sensor histidine kinase TctE
LSTLLVESSQALARPHPAELRPTLERLQAAAERGAHLAQQLLTLARAEGANLGTDALHQPVDLAALAGAAADDWLRPSLAAGQDLGFDLQPAPVHGDALLLREMLGNLVLNAIRHAGPAAHVTVRTRTADGQAVLEVEDDGRGIPATELEAVWQRFHRGHGATGLGTGLGLAIVRDIARLHRGEARLQAGADGRGIVARVSLPAAEPVAKLS